MFTFRLAELDRRLTFSHLLRFSLFLACVACRFLSNLRAIGKRESRDKERQSREERSNCLNRQATQATLFLEPLKSTEFTKNQTNFNEGLMGTCGQPGYAFRDFCLKQGIEFIIFCLNQGIGLSVFVLNRISFLG